MKLPYWLNSSRLWDTQNAIFTGTGSVKDLRPYWFLMLLIRVTGATNISIRQDVATGNVDRAIRDFQKLTYSGYYCEKFSYLKNIETALIWLEQKNV